MSAPGQRTRPASPPAGRLLLQNVCPGSGSSCDHHAAQQKLPFRATSSLQGFRLNLFEHSSCCLHMSVVTALVSKSSLFLSLCLAFPRFSVALLKGLQEGDRYSYFVNKNSVRQAHTADRWPSQIFTALG